MFSMKTMSANKMVPDGSPRFGASHVVILCLPMSYKMDAGLIWVNVLILKLIFNTIKSISMCCFVCPNLVEIEMQTATSDWKLLL